LSIDRLIDGRAEEKEEDRIPAVFFGGFCCLQWYCLQRDFGTAASGIFCGIAMILGVGQNVC
jgi:hypothetical protein